MKLQCQRSVPHVSLCSKDSIFMVITLSLTVVTSEASLVVDLAISSKLINQVHSFLTCLALLGSPCKCCHSQKSSKPRNLIKFQNNNNKNMNNIGNCPSLMTLSPSNSLLSLSNSLVWDLQLRTCQSKPNQLTRSGSLFRLSAYTNCQLCIPCGPNYIQLRLCPQKGQVSSYSFSQENSELMLYDQKSKGIFEYWLLLKVENWKYYNKIIFKYIDNIE